MGANFHANRERIEARYPFYRSTVVEREALFGPAPLRRARPPPARVRAAHRRLTARRGRAYHALVDSSSHRIDRVRLDICGLAQPSSARRLARSERCLRAPDPGGADPPGAVPAEGIITSWDFEDWPARALAIVAAAVAYGVYAPDFAGRLFPSAEPAARRAHDALFAAKPAPTPAASRRGQRVEAGRRVGRCGETRPTIPSSSTGSARSRPRTR